MIIDKLIGLLVNPGSHHMQDEQLQAVFKEAVIHINNNRTGLFERRGDPSRHTDKFDKDCLSLLMYGLLCNCDSMWGFFVDFIRNIEIDHDELRREILRSVVYLQKQTPLNEKKFAVRARTIGTNITDKIIQHDEKSTCGHIISFMSDDEISSMVNEHLAKTVLMEPEHYIESDRKFSETIGKSINPKLSYTVYRLSKKDSERVEVEVPIMIAFINSLYHAYTSIQVNSKPASRRNTTAIRCYSIIKDIILNMICGHNEQVQDFEMIQNSLCGRFYRNGSKSYTAFDCLIHCKEYELAAEITKKYDVDINRIHSLVPSWYECVVVNGSNKLRELIKIGADIGMTSPNKSNTLMNYAIKRGSLDLVKDLYQNLGIDLHAHCNHYLEQACVNGRTDIVRFFIEQGINVEERFASIEHHNAIFCAAQNGYLDLFNLLIEEGATLSGRTQDLHRNILHCAVNISHSTYKKNDSERHIINEDDKITIINAILDKDKSLINEIDGTGYTPLMIAISMYFEKAAINLIENQAQVITDDYGDTSVQNRLMFYATENGCNGVVSYLCKNGYSANATIGLGGKTPIFVAKDISFTHSARIYIPKDIQENYILNHPPIIKSSYEHLIDTLLANGANINSSDINGVNALYHVLPDIESIIEDGQFSIEGEERIYLDTQLKYVNVLMDKGACPLMESIEEARTPLIVLEDLHNHIIENNNEYEFSSTTIDRLRDTITRMQGKMTCMTP